MSEPRTKSFIGGRFGTGVTFTIPDRCEPIPCKGCRHYHPPDSAHRGNPSTWNVEQTNLVQHRELSGELDSFQRDLEQLGKSELRWFDAAALAVYRRDQMTRFAWLSPPGLDHEEDMTLFIGVPGTTVNLRCGVVLRVTEGRTGRVDSPKEIHQAHDPVILLGLTGILAEVTRAPNAMSAEAFLAHGAKVAAKLARQVKSGIIMRVKAQQSQEVSDHE